MAFTRPVSFLFVGGVAFSCLEIRVLTSLHLLAAQAPPNGIQHIIWAFSRTPPESAESNANFSAHHEFGSTTLNLTHTVVLSDDGAAPIPPSEGGEDEGAMPLNSDTLAESDSPKVGATTGVRNGGVASFVHAGLCVVAFLLVIPSGALVVRYAKLTGSSAALDLHRNLQFGVGTFASGSFGIVTPRSLCFRARLVASHTRAGVLYSRLSWRIHRGGHAGVSSHG